MEMVAYKSVDTQKIQLLNVLLRTDLNGGGKTEKQKKVLQHCMIVCK